MASTHDRRERRRRGGGFTLVEIVVVILVFAVAALGLISMFGGSSTRTADPLLESQALQLAREKLETVIGDRGNPARGFDFVSGVNYPAENPVPGFPGFARTVAVACVDAADLNVPTGGPPPPCASGYARVTVTVTRQPLGPVVLDTVLARHQ